VALNELELKELEKATEKPFELPHEWVLVKDENGEVVDEEPKFRIENLEQASWVFRKISVLKKRQEEIRELAEKEIERIRNWQEAETNKYQRSIEFFESLLQEYIFKERQKDPKFKTVSTPYGKATLRKMPPKWNYDDEKLLTFLKQSGKQQFIRVKEEVNKAELKKVVKVVGDVAVDENGEVIEGITIEEQPEKLIVEVEGGEK